jgi:hypothetical protein
LHRIRFCLALLSLSLCAGLAVAALPSGVATPTTRPAAGNPREESGKHPDGSLAFRVRLGADGKRNGDFTGYFEGGKKVQERSHYEAGELHGMRTTFDEKGKVTADETWWKGKVVFPKSPKLIEATREQIKRDVVDYLRKLNPAVPKGGMSLNALGEALIKVRTYRYLCDVPYDVGYDASYIDLCQHAAELMGILGQLTHTPSRPAGVSDEFYEKGKKGCGSSNIFTGNNISQSVDMYMDDSDKSNIDRLGHRRWVLNPKMQNTGFGAGAGKYSAMYSMDARRSEVPEYSVVSFPPKGYMPVSMFPARAAWHASFNTSLYSVSASSTKMAIYPVDGKLNRAKEPLELDYQHVDTEGFGIPNAVIARPKNVIVKPGAMYEVVISGLSPKKDAPAEVSYFVAFY